MNGCSYRCLSVPFIDMLHHFVVNHEVGVRSIFRLGG